MPLTQPRRNNPLMRSYVDAIGLSGKALANVCGVSHSQLYMARERNVGAKNAEKIASGIAKRLGLSLQERLALKAEITGHPGNLVRAYLGDGREAAGSLGEGEHIGGKVVGGGEIPHAPGVRVVRRLEEMGAPSFVVEDVRARVAPEPVRVGRVTHRQSGLEARNRRAEGLFNLRVFKPLTHEALQKAGLPKKEIRRRARIGKETLRIALYRKTGRSSAAKIAEVLGDELGLTEEEREAIRDELVRAPRKTFEEIFAESD